MPAQPTSRLVWSTDRSVKTERQTTPRPATTFLVFATPVAAHLANLGHLLEEVVLKDNRVCWRVPFAAQSDCDRYGETMKRLNEARSLTQAMIMGGVYTGPRSKS